MYSFYVNKLKLTESSRFKCVVCVNCYVSNLVMTGNVILNIFAMSGNHHVTFLTSEC